MVGVLVRGANCFFQGILGLGIGLLILLLDMRASGRETGHYEV